MELKISKISNFKMIIYYMFFIFWKSWRLNVSSHEYCISVTLLHVTRCRLHTLIWREKRKSWLNFECKFVNGFLKRRKQETLMKVCEKESMSNLSLWVIRSIFVISNLDTFTIRYLTIRADYNIEWISDRKIKFCHFKLYWHFRTSLALWWVQNERWSPQRPQNHVTISSKMAKDASEIA